MEVSIAEVAELLNGRCDGGQHGVLSGFAGIEEANEGDLTFLANPAYELHIYSTRASAVLVSEQFEPNAPLQAGTSLIRVEDPYAAMAKLMQRFGTDTERTTSEDRRIHPSAVVADSASIGEGVSIGPLCHVGEGSMLGKGVVLKAGSVVGEQCSVGAHSILGMRSVLGDGCILGEGCILQIGAIIGADGFGFAPTESGYEKIPQVGNVTIGDGAEIGAGTTIDRATMGSTIIGKGVKLDNLIQVAHNVRIGDHTVIAAQTGIAGSTEIGAHCMIGGQVGINGHIKIADHTRIAAKSGITASITTPNQVLQGNPALPIRKHQEMQLALRKLAREFNRKSTSSRVGAPH